MAAETANCNGDRRVDCYRLSTLDDGTQVKTDSITGWFRDYISRTYLPYISFHSLRHRKLRYSLRRGSR